MQARAASGREEIEEYEGESEPSMKLSQAFVVVLLLHVVAVAGIYGFNQLKEKPAKPVTAKAESSDNASVAAASEKKTEQPAKSESQPAAKAQSTQTSYSVVAGDTLRRIASKFNTSIESIEKANSLTSTSILKVGQVLSIPSTAKSQANAAPTSTATAKASSTPAVVAKASMEKTPAAHEKNEATPKEQGQSSSGEKTYVVAKGDNPYSLAKKYNITQEALMKANNIDDPKKLKIGQKLVIP
ncbi:MAG: LysM peptidoglycan-binding domain-containing protein [bacterium]